MNKTDGPDGCHNLEKQNYENADHLINAHRPSCRNPDLVGRDDQGKQQDQIEALTTGLQKVSDQLELTKPAPQMVDNNQ